MSKSPLFTSNREKRLWIWVIAALIAILLSLGFAGELSGVLFNEQSTAALFILGCLLVLATVVTQGLTKRPSRNQIGIFLGIVAVYLLVFVRFSIPAERSHLIEYGVVALLIFEALIERRNQGRSVPIPSILAIVVTSAIGVVDESIQAFLPNRVFDPRDMLFNGLAAVMAVASSTALRWDKSRGYKG